MTATLLKFPYSVSRRAHSRRPRRSKNGSPEQRAAAANVSAVCEQEDPIFAAIERHRAADAAHTAACNAEQACGEANGNDASEAACAAAFDALADLVAITPTTRAGCAAMLRYVHVVTMDSNHYSEGNLFCGYTRVEKPAADLLLRLADRIEAA